MKTLCAIGVSLLFVLPVFAQTDRGTITGTVLDPAGAVVPNAAVSAKNTETDAVFTAASTNTGNYTLASLPIGTYELEVTASGFKKYVRPGIQVEVAETVRADANLQIGAATDTVTVNAEAPLLKTESGELSHQIDYTRADELPIFTLGAGTSLGNIRDPLAVLNLLPGASQSSNAVLRINGLPSNSQAIRVEGQDATDGLWREVNAINQQSADAIQEVSVQTSNYAAEYGQAGGGYINYTMKSGTNQLHGSGYDYFDNEFLNAGLPFTQHPCYGGAPGCIEHIKNDVRRNDYGFTVGGPVKIPKIYNGKDKTFFFFNFEQFRQVAVTASTPLTAPLPAYQQGNFAGAPVASDQICPGGKPQNPLSSTTAFNPAAYAAGVPCYAAGTIFDPNTRMTLAGGVIAETPFQGNMIPQSRLDPVALYMQNKLFIQPQTTGSLNNYTIPAYSNFRHTTIPAFKLDHNLSSSMKLSGYFSETITNSPASNGLAVTLAPPAPTADNAYTVRANFDQTITPTLLLHIGVGLAYINHPVYTVTSNFDATAASLTNGAFQPFPANTYMPSFAGLTNTLTGGLSSAVGPGGFDESDLKDIRPTGNASMTWVRGNHTYKAGFEMALEGFPQQSSIRAFGEYTFSNIETENPIESSNGGPFYTGFQYASFLLGRVDSVQSSAINDTRLGNHTVALFLQDNWKITRRITLDYGLRWDRATLLSEEHGQMSDASFLGINPNLTSPTQPNGLVGTTVYGATCHCNLNDTYNFAFGPRIGVAYQVGPKTVIRAGGGISYSTSPNNAYLSYSVANFFTENAPGFGIPATQLSNGNPFVGANSLTFPGYSQSPGYSTFPYPSGALNCGPIAAGAISGTEACVPPTEPFIYIAKGAGRLPRIFQWSIGVQHEIIPNLLIEAAYVGNRGAWWTAPLLDTQAADGLTPQGLLAERRYGDTTGLDVTNPSQAALLTDQINNPAVLAKFPGLANPDNVYKGFPATSPLLDALRNYPQWTGVPPFLGPPLGDTWYDSLQVKLTKRYSRGLTVQAAYTFAKQLTNAANSDTSFLTPNDPLINDVYNQKTLKQLAGLDQPQTMLVNFTYTTPKNKIGGDGFAGKTLQYLTRDFTFAGVLRYASGMLIRTPPSANNLKNELGLGATPLNGVQVFGGTTTFENYVPGQSCFAPGFNPNSHYNPETTLTLNPAAWTDVPAGTYGVSAPYYGNCRWQRQPQESLSVGRLFRIKEKYQLQIRAEFTNPFNRVFYSMPSVPVSTTAPTRNNPFPVPGETTGALSAGFGYVSTLNGAGTSPRTGQLVARFTF
jgi:hypothetical protein